MGKNKIATKTDTLRYKIAKEVFGEIEDSDGITEIPSWQIFEKTLDLYKENTILKKALELACNITNCNFLVGYKPEYFIEQAKESINGNKNKI